MATAETRKHPNILITGTPGSGKSTLSEILAKKLGLVSSLFLFFSFL